jgi:hypothetical protein
MEEPEALATDIRTFSGNSEAPFGLKFLGRENSENEAGHVSSAKTATRPLHSPPIYVNEESEIAYRALQGSRR